MLESQSMKSCPEETQGDSAFQNYSSNSWHLFKHTYDIPHKVKKNDYANIW